MAPTRRRTGPAREKPLNAFGRALEAERAASRYATIEALCEAADVKYRTLYSYMSEGGTKKIPAEVVEKLADALGISVERLRTTPRLRLVRDDDRGVPSVEAYIEAHPDLEPRYVEELRGMAAKAGPESFTYEVVDGIVRGFRARDRGKRIERPEITE